MPGSTTPTLATSSAPTRSGSRVGEMSMHTRRTTRRHSVIVPGWMTPNPSQCQANTFRSSIPACSPPALTFLPGATDHLDGHSDTTEPTKFQALFLCPYQTLRRKTLLANRLPAWTPIAGRGIVHPQIMGQAGPAAEASSLPPTHRAAARRGSPIAVQSVRSAILHSPPRVSRLRVLGIFMVEMLILALRFNLFLTRRMLFSIITGQHY